MQKTTEYYEFIECARNSFSGVLQIGRGNIEYVPSGTFNGQRKDYMIVRLAEENAEYRQGMLRLYPEEMYQNFRRGISLEEMADQLARKKTDGFDQVRKTDILGSLKEYGKIKSRLVIRAINFRTNEQCLKSVVYRRIGDIALVLYMVILDKDPNYITARIEKASFREWGRQEDEVFREALCNTNALYPPRIYDFLKDSWKVDYDTGAFMNPVINFPMDKQYNGYCITNIKKLNGATAVFYPGVAEKISSILEDDFYLAFTSIHEAMLHSFHTTDPKMIKDNLIATNRINKFEEILTEEVYCYSAEKQEFSMVKV